MVIVIEVGCDRFLTKWQKSSFPDLFSLKKDQDRQLVGSKWNNMCHFAVGKKMTQKNCQSIIKELLKAKKKLFWWQAKGDK